MFPEGFDSLEDKNPVGSKENSTPIPQEVLDSLREKIMAEVANHQGITTKFVILDGFILYVNEQLRETIDVKFFLTAPYQVLKERRESRKGYATLEGNLLDIHVLNHSPPAFQDQPWRDRQNTNHVL